VLADGVVGSVLFRILADELEGDEDDTAADDRRMYPGRLALGDKGRVILGVALLPDWLALDMLQVQR
jgi:hypothetical protein